MPKQPTAIDADIVAAFNAYEAQQRIANTKVGCALVVTLMPLGSTMDYFFYHGSGWSGRDWLWPFFFLRLLCSGLAAAIWIFLFTESGQKRAKPLGVVVPLLPVVFLAGMIAVTDGFNSTYYAALNLVLLAVGAVLHWTLRESIVAVLLALAMYIGAGCFQGHFPELKYIFNNFYFIALMDIIVVVGTYFQSRQRFREFAFKFELNKSKHDLEASNTKLGEQNIALNQANREIKEAEAQLVQSEKMSSLGRFSAGLMHDILNPLNYSRTGLFVLRKKTRKLPPELLADTDAVLNDVEDGLKRVEDIVSDLRTFTHPGAQAAEEVSLADVFNIAQRFISSELKDKNISLKLDLAPGQTVWAGRNHFILVVVNLLENAIDALGEKKFTDGDQAAIEVSSRTEGERSRLRIRDNGPGIAPQNLAKIFDPFFTTKEVGKGTGLGLSICFGIVRGYGGTIAVTSEPGRFCEFILDLPATEAAAAKTKPEHAEPLRI